MNTQPTLSFTDLLKSEEFKNNQAELPVILGKTKEGKVIVEDLTKMPHVLMAGATGQGKSVGLNVIINSILHTKNPDQVKFVMIDPKRVELAIYAKIEKQYLAMPIVTNPEEALNTLNALCTEMDKRYETLKQASVRNIKEYNAKEIKKIPYIVLIVDEFADLILVAGKQIETPIMRLAQLARAVGIHLIIATQRPSVNVITGNIKANFPARIAFKVTNKIDSRTILDEAGAEELLGNGDMLFKNEMHAVNVQCPYINIEEIEIIVSDKSLIIAEPFSLNDNNKNEVLKEAATIFINNGFVSTSLLQRKMKITYSEAGRLINDLENLNVISSSGVNKNIMIKSINELSF